VGTDPELAKNRKAIAVVTTSLAQRITGNFFIGLSKSKTNTCIFKSEDEAKKWLLGKINKD